MNEGKRSTGTKQGGGGEERKKKHAMKTMKIKKVEEIEMGTLCSQKEEERTKQQVEKGGGNEGRLHLWPLFIWRTDRKTERQTKADKAVEMSTFQ